MNIVDEVDQSLPVRDVSEEKAEVLGFIDVKDYGLLSSLDGEIGTIQDFRFIPRVWVPRLRRE